MARRPAPSRRPGRTGRTVRTGRSAGAGRPVTGGSPCPCGGSAPYGSCCGRFHTGSEAVGAGATPPTAELLMRSRYSAFVVLDAAYLLRTWDPATRPARLDLDPETLWQGLEILATTEGSAFHTTGTVTFRARFTDGGRPGELHERSRFARHAGAWVYVDGTFLD
ncbi:YchJ family protein [Streptomyces sp. NPDC059255]|uniref:YchJ family protein n=1 Tax=Streptomyces sp. NPDC059255 TaxID=3346793 RepID=UPI0036CA3301